MTYIKKIYYIVIGFIMIALASASMPFVKADEEGFGTSGPFAGYHYKLVQGETISIPQVYVTFYNNYNTDIEIEIWGNDIPEGVSLDLPRGLVPMDANSILRVPVSITTDNDAPAGDYLIGVAAEVVPKEINGIQIIGSAQLTAKLSIYGEAGNYSITTETASGDPFVADLTVYRRDESYLTPVGFSEDGTLADRVVPGDYFAQVIYDGKIVAEQDFTLNDGDDIEILLIAKTVFINSFLVGPIFDEETDFLQSAQIAYTVENIYEPIDEVRLMLIVLRNGEEIDNIEIMYLGYLNTGEFSGRYYYIPTEGWRAGDYSFKLEIYEDHTTDVETYLHDDTDYKTYEVPRNVIEGAFSLWFVIIPIFVLILIGIIIFLLFFKQDELTFIEKVKKSKKEIRDFYYDISKTILEVKNGKHTLSDTEDTYYIGRKKIAIMRFDGKTLFIALRGEQNDYAHFNVTIKMNKDDASLSLTPLMVNMTSAEEIRMIKYNIEQQLPKQTIVKKRTKGGSKP
jgi:hypothetical protein